MKIQKCKSVEKELDIKRFYPPFKVVDTCGECGGEALGCGEDLYISYPNLVDGDDLYFCCHECGHEWEGDKKVLVCITGKLV